MGNNEDYYTNKINRNPYNKDFYIERADYYR